MNHKAIALLSGGLDSTLAVKLMIDQGIDVSAIHFTSIFCNCTPKKAGCRLHAEKIAAELKIPIRVINKGMDYMRMVERPPHGYGRGMNPCIDCRIYMLRKVKDMLPQMEASFVITGEVLGQRPMSQHRNTLRIIERESGLEGLILRPLSAKHFDPTLPEREGIVDRNLLLSFSGRSRKPQIELARELDIRDYPCPAGGCLLTDKEVAARLRDLFVHCPDYDMVDLHLLKVGRHFRLNPQLKIVVGRDAGENEKINSIARSGATLIEPRGFRGPIVYIRGITNEASESAIGRIIARYSQDRQIEYPVRKRVIGGRESVLVVKDGYPTEELDAYRIS